MPSILRPVLRPALSPVLQKTLTPIKGVGFYPTALGSDLIDLWDIERADLLVLASSLINSWTSVKLGVALTQSVSGSKFAYSATSFNGRPGATSDGLDDEMTYAGAQPFPTGSSPCEIWWLGDQLTPGSDGTTRTPFAYGTGASAVNSRRLNRRQDGSTSRARATVGTGAGTFSADNVAAAFQGKSVVRLQIGATESIVSVNGTPDTAQAGIPNSSGNSVRMGAASHALTAYANSITSMLAVTLPLGAAAAAQMLAFMKARGGIA